MMKKICVIAVSLCLVLMFTACNGVLVKPDEASEQYELFMDKADEIEDYNEAHFETATTQLEYNTESYQVYMKWDALLNEVYRYLESTMDAEAFAALEAEEIAWIQEKESAIEAAGNAWKGGSAEALARNAEGIEYTRERCYYLISLIKGK